MKILKCGMPLSSKSQPTIMEVLNWLEDSNDQWIMYMGTEGAHERVKQSIDNLMKKEKAYVATMDAQ